MSHWLGRFSLLSATIILLFFSACENDLARVNRLISRDQASVETGEDITILYSDSAEVKIKIEGPRMIRKLSTAEPEEIFPEGVKIYFLDDQKQPESILSAKYAIRYPFQDKVIVKDSVVLENIKEKRKIVTEELIWEMRRAIVYNNKFVKITNPTDTIYGYAFKATQDFQHYELKNVGGKMAIKAMEKELK